MARERRLEGRAEQMVTRPARGGRPRRPAGEPGGRAPKPLGTSSGLPLFPNATSPSAAAAPEGPRTRSPLAVRRPPPDPTQPSVRAGREKSERQLSFDAPAVGTTTDGLAAAASLSSRLIAGGLDAAFLLLLDAVVVGLTLRLAGLDVDSLDALPIAPLAVFLLLLDAGYVVVLTSTRGQTFGKMAVGIRAVDAAGHPVTIAAALIRAATMVVSMLPAGAGLVWMCVVRDRRGLHDRVAGTRVVVV